MMNRRAALRGLLGGSAAAAAMPLVGRRALGADKRVLKIMSNANVAAIHVPGNVAAREIVQTIGDYGPTDLKRLEKMGGITQVLVGGGLDIVDGDTPSVFAAVAAGADLKIVGQFYGSTDLVFAVNADKVQSLSDFEKPDIVIGINSPGEVTHALLVGVLMKHKINLDKVQMLSLGGSSARTRALLGGRVHCVPIHADQATVLAREGNFKVLIKPWEEYEFWSNECWAVNGTWLKEPGNRKVVVDMMEAALRANKLAMNDFNWFADKFRKYSNDKDAAKWSDDQIRSEWDLMVKEIKAWPVPTPLDVAAFNTLIPIYEKAGILQPGSKANFDNIVDPSFLAEAQKRIA